MGSQAPAHEHGSTLSVISACIIVRKKLQLRRKQTAIARNPNQAAMGMTADDQIRVNAQILFEKGRIMSQKNLQGIFLLFLRKKALDIAVSHLNVDQLCIIRKINVQAADLQQISVHTDKS